MYLAITERTREAFKEIPAADLGDDNGLDKIIMKLDSLFLKDECTRAYISFKELPILRTVLESFSRFYQ